MKILKKEIPSVHFWLFLGTVSSLLAVVLFHARSKLTGNKGLLEAYLSMMNQSSTPLTEEEKQNKKKINDLAFSAWGFIMFGHISFFIAFLLVLQSWAGNKKQILS